MRQHRLFIGMIAIAFFSIISSAQLQAQSASLTLAWDPNEEADLSHYVLYCDEVPGTMVAKTNIPKSQSTFTDYDVEVGKTYYYKMTAVDYYGNESDPSNEVSATVSEVTGIVSLSGSPVNDYALGQNYPNPFNPSTNIEYDMKEAGSLKISIFDVLGREVTVLVDGYSEAGRFSIQWNGKDTSARDMASGIYFYQMVAGDQRIVKKLTLER